MPGDRDVPFELDDVELEKEHLGVGVESATALVVCVLLALAQNVPCECGAVGGVVVDEALAHEAVVVAALAFHALALPAWPRLQRRRRFEGRGDSTGNVRRQVRPLFVVVFLERKAHGAVGCMVVAELVALLAVVGFAMRLACAHAAAGGDGAALLIALFGVDRVRLTLVV